MHRTYDFNLGHSITNIYAGEYCIGEANEIISTVLGSCISVCLFDSLVNIGGMNHFLLPSPSNHKNSMGLKMNSLYFGVNAMDKLLEDLLKHSANIASLSAKIFGGASLFSGKSKYEDVGSQNISFAKNYLKKNNIEITSENVGGTRSRQIYFIPSKNRVFMKNID